MANLYADLPMPVLNGPGAAVDVSGMGGEKTVVVHGAFPGATITIEISQDAGGAGVYAPVTSFQTGDQRRLLQVAARFMRVNVQGRKSSVAFTANADVGANDAGALFAVLPMPAGNGAGAAVNVSALGTFCTFVVGGSFPGARVLVEASEDGVDYAPVVAFAGYGGQQSKVVTGDFMRVSVEGRKATLPFTATAAVGAINDPITSSAGSPTNWQSFPYVCTGLEAQLFTVPIPVAQPDALYQVRCLLGTTVRQFGVELVDGSELVNQFDVTITTTPEAGDVIHFDVFNAP